MIKAGNWAHPLVPAAFMIPVNQLQTEKRGNAMSISLIKIKILEMAIENHRRICIGVSQYGNFERAVGRTKIKGNILIFNKKPLQETNCTWPDFNEAEQDLLDSGFIEKFHLNNNKIIIKPTQTGIRFYNDFVRHELDEDIVELLSTFYKNNAKKFFKKPADK